MWLAIVCALLVACGNHSVELDKAEPLDNDLVQPEPPPLDCFARHQRLRSKVRGAYAAKDHLRNERDAIAAARATPPACRSGAWYLAVARLLDLQAELEIPGLALHTPEDALAAALRQPDDVDVLARVAQASALGHPIALPLDACERARAVAGSEYEGKDSAHYVCARVAIAAGRGKQAIAELDAVVVPGLLGDFELARAQAATLAGDRVATVRYARAAIASNRRNFYLTAEDRSTIERLAQALTR